MGLVSSAIQRGFSMVRDRLGLLGCAQKMDPNMPQSLHIPQGSFKVKTIARGEPSTEWKYTIGRQKHSKTMKKPASTGLNDGGTAAVRSSRSTVHI